ncbi:50S ribosomal protein L13 [Candidatus Peregrinibacteria bacterium]|nr:50S ribosomal protein L13 [Candidatus Peregrinibacteria bacterium]
MKTSIPKQSEIEKKWYLVDAKDKVPGRIATKIADILRGKHKPIWSPHMDCGDHVVVINAAHIHLTGRKLEQKVYHRHSGYPGALKTIPVSRLLEEKPEQVLKKIISGMIPKNRLKKKIIDKLKIFPESEHNHIAQKPETLNL